MTFATPYTKAVSLVHIGGEVWWVPLFVRTPLPFSNVKHACSNSRQSNGALGTCGHLGGSSGRTSLTEPNFIELLATRHETRWGSFFHYIHFLYVFAASFIASAREHPFSCRTFLTCSTQALRCLGGGIYFSTLLLFFGNRSLIALTTSGSASALL